MADAYQCFPSVISHLHNVRKLSNFTAAISGNTNGSYISRYDVIFVISDVILYSCIGGDVMINMMCMIISDLLVDVETQCEQFCFYYNCNTPL